MGEIYRKDLTVKRQCYAILTLQYTTPAADGASSGQFQLAVDVLELDIVGGEDYEVEADSLYLFSSTLAAKRELSKFTLLFGMLESFFLTQDTGGMTATVDRFQLSGIC